ncbi:MAG: ATP-binding cassette domain-containing protein [Deltaproteobacteria bacterium]|nr:ATP-binding cassette domain-containing protein [Deltaproteobacteria bacterium]
MTGGRAAAAEGKAVEGRDEKLRRQALVYVQKLTKLYPISRGLFREPRLLHALDDVSFYVRHNETFGLVGESGSGKSTLGRCVIRLTEPTVGRVIFDGRDLTAMPPVELRATRQRMQIVFQDPYGSLDPNMTVRDIVREGIDVFGLAKSRAEGNDRVDHLLGRVGLEPTMGSRYPHEFSGGQRQRIAIARALAVEPEFIVLDEPTSALDLSVQAQILNLLQDLQEDLGLSQLFISHDLRVVQYVSHRIAVMYLGRFVELGPSDAVARRRYHPYTRALFGAMPLTAAEAARRKQLKIVLEGEPPSALDPPRGCAFFARCPNAEAGLCDDEAPRLSEIISGSHHRVACWHPEVD